MKDRPELTRDKVYANFESRFLNVFGYEYLEGKQYMNATRRNRDDLVALKSDQEFKSMVADAVSCIVILDGEEPQLLLSYEFRYPVAQYLLGVPAGLIDPADKEKANPLIATAIRELQEETGIDISPEDRVEVVNPLLFSTPGMTDESNAIVLVVIADYKTKQLSQEGCEGTECFDGFELLTRDDAMRIIKQGKDDKGIFYSVYTWMALMYFVSDLWR